MNTHALAFSSLIQRVKNTHDSEPEQIAIRLIIGIFLVLYFCFPWAEGETFATKIVSLDSLITLSYYTGAVLIAFALIYYPIASPARRVAGIALDMISLSIVMYFVGEKSVFLFVLYPWVILGNGFRYGLNYLYIALVISVIGFACAITWGDYWRDYHNEVIGLSLLFLLVMIPAYSAFLVKKLHAAIELANQANEAKTRFLANMTHELRTPLNGVIGMGSLLRETPLNDEQKSLVKSLYESSQTLLGLIENVLDISKIEAGKISIKHERMDLHALVNSILSMQLPIARTKGLQLWCTFDSELPFLVNGDRQHLSQVLINLIGNSIKFTDVGSIHVHVLAVNQSNGNVNVRFEITDTGIGIQEEALPRVFDDFTQVSTSALRTIGGTGLGTTIAKQLVTLMKGDIGVISEYEKGSTFWFEIPFDVVSDEESYQITSSLVVLALEQRLPSVSRHLEQWGLAYDVAQSPAHLKSIIKPQSKTVVLVDEASLGSLSALQLAHELRALNTNASYSLILICHESSMIDESLLTQYYSSIVNHIDNKRVLFNAIHTAETVKFESDNVINLFDYYKQTNGVAALSILVADDNQVNRQVIESILRKVGHKVTLVSDGDEALDYLANHLDEVDLLILDKNMPNRSGDEVLKALAFMSPKQTFPVIMLTADATPEAKKESVELGVDDFLIKPIDAYALLDAIARLSVSEKVNTSEIVQSASTVEEATIPLCEPDALKQLMMLDSDPGFIQRLIDGFEYDANKHIKTILASVEHDFLELREALHALKGSANELGAKRLVSLCLSGEEIKPHQMGTEPVIQLATEIKDTYALTMNEIRTIISGK